MESVNFSEIDNKANQQVLVDVPVLVERKPELPVNPTKKTPKRWMFYLGFGPVILVLIFLVLKNGQELPDLEIVVPTNNVSKSNLSTMVAPEYATNSALVTESVYRDESAGFEISPPLGWQMDKSGKTGAIVNFINPVTKKIGNVGYATLISVEKQNVGEVVLSERVKVIKDNLSKEFTNFVFENDSLFYLKGQPYYLIGGTFQVDGVDMRKRSLITIYKGDGFAVSATGPLVTWPDNESEISKTQFSFKLL